MPSADRTRQPIVMKRCSLPPIRLWRRLIGLRWTAIQKCTAGQISPLASCAELRTARSTVGRSSGRTFVHPANRRSPVVDVDQLFLVVFVVDIAIRVETIDNGHDCMVPDMGKRGMNIR